DMSYINQLTDITCAVSIAATPLGAAVPAESRVPGPFPGRAPAAVGCPRDPPTEGPHVDPDRETRATRSSRPEHPGGGPRARPRPHRSRHPGPRRGAG